MEILDGISDPFRYGLAALLFGGWVGLLWVVRLILTGKLCSDRELSAVTKERDEWKKLAFRLLVVTDRTTGVAEVLHDVAARIPDPALLKGPE